MSSSTVMFWSSVVASIATVLASLVVIPTAVLAFRQLREMKKATIAQAFSIVLGYLQEPEIRKARKLLLSMEQADFPNWIPEQIENCELVCSTYDAIGILLRREVVDPQIVISSWRWSIIQCWQHAEPMIIEYRKARGLDYWDDFEWLVNCAQSQDC